MKSLRAAVVAGLVAGLAASTSAAALTADDLPLSIDLIRLDTTIRAGSSAAAVVEVANVSGGDLNDHEVVIALTEDPLASRESVSAFLEEPAQARLAVVDRHLLGAPRTDDEEADDDEAPAPIYVFAADARTHVTLELGAAAAWLPEEWGVYGMAWGVSDGDDVVWLDATAITWEGTGVPAVDVTFVATVSDVPVRTSALLQAANHERVALIVDSGSVNSPDVDRPSMVDRERYRMPYGNPDLTSLAHHDAGDIANVLLGRSVTEAPHTLADVPWIAQPPVLDSVTLAFIHEHGAVATIVQPRYGAVAPERATATGTPVVNVFTDSGVVPVVVPDAELSALVASYRPHHPATPARIVAETALAAAQVQGAPLVISPGPSWVVDGTLVAPVITELFNASFVTPIPLSTTLSYPTRDSGTVPDLLGMDDSIAQSDLHGFTQRWMRVEALAEAAAQPRAVTDPHVRELGRALSVLNREDPDIRAGYLASLLEGLDQTMDSVAITPRSDVNLVSSSGSLPISIRNSLDTDVTVTVIATSRSPILTIDGRPEITVAAGSEATAMVPVTAVSSGNVDVSLSLRNEAGVTVSDYESFEMRVRAEWGNAFAAVASIALVALLIAGVVRTARRGRADTRVGPQDFDALAVPETVERDRD